MGAELKPLAAYLLLATAALAHDHGSDLVPESQASHIAVQTGDWSDTSTWGGEIPGTGSRVVIPRGIAVRQMGVAEALWIRVEDGGVFSVARNVPTQTYVHTIWGAAGSWIDIGTPMQPVTAGCVLEFTDGPFLDGDWSKLSRGIVSSGLLTVWGMDTTAYLTAASEVPAGATSVTLDAVPFGWHIGDTILIAGTDSKDRTGYANFSQKPGAYQTERVEIVSVRGRVVEFSPAAQFRHWSWRPDLRFHVSHLHRNIQIRSRLSLPIEQRGHIMLMNNGHGDYRPATIGFAHFLNLARTDKAVAVTDPRLDANGVLVPGSDANRRGSYVIHWHHTGPLSPPSYVVGVVIEGSPGWGLVNHDGNVHVADSVAVNCFGSGFTTEEGQERGSFRRCLAALNRGLGDTVTSTDADHGGGSDWGRDGSGFWLQGGMVEVSDCVSFDNGGRGFGLFNRSLNGWNQEPNQVPAYLWYPITISKTVLPEQYGSDVASGAVPFIAPFHRNQAYMNKVGVQAWSSIYDYRPPAVIGTLKNTLIWGRGSQMHLEYLRPTHKVDGLTVVGDLLIRPNGSDSYSKYNGGCKVRFITQGDVTNYSQVGTAGNFEAP